MEFSISEFSTHTKQGACPTYYPLTVLSYGVEDAEYAVSQLAQTTMRSEIGQLTLDHVLKERQNLNANITEAINDTAQDWVEPKQFIFF
jgi:regulator of protease activity HflC (stomatin/prohibitin superfamily)